MADVEESDGSAHSAVLFQNAGVLNWHIPASEVHHAGFRGYVSFEKRGPLEASRGRCHARKPSVARGPRGKGLSNWACQTPIGDPLRFCQWPLVKSGKAAGALPCASEASLSGVGADQLAASYTSISGGRPLRIHSRSR